MAVLATLYGPPQAGGGSSSSLTPPGTIDGTGLTTSVPLLIKNAKNLSGLELQQTGTAATGFILRDAAGVQQGAIGLNNAANDWETPSLAGDIVIVGSATSGKGIVITPAAGNTNGRVELLSTVGVVGTNGGYVSVSDATGTIVGYNATKITFVSVATVTGPLAISASTSTSAVALQVAGDPNTGICAVSGADTLSMVCGGNARVNATAAGGNLAGVWTFSGNITFDGGSRIIADTSVSLTSVAYSFSGDPNTGIGAIGGADTLSVVCGGVEQVRVSTTLMTVNGKLSIPTAQTQATIGANGGAAALTVLPVGYIKVDINGAAMIVPYYNA